MSNRISNTKRNSHDEAFKSRQLDYFNYLHKHFKEIQKNNGISDRYMSVAVTREQLALLIILEQKC